MPENAGRLALVAAEGSRRARSFDGNPLHLPLLGAALMFRRLGLGFRLLLCAGALLAPVSECLAQAGAATGPSQTRSGGALPVVIEVRSSGLDPEGVKVAIERELGVPLRVDAEAWRWTERAVAIVWTVPGGKEHRAWVWASAVERV